MLVTPLHLKLPVAEGRVHVFSEGILSRDLHLGVRADLLVQQDLLCLILNC